MVYFRRRGVPVGVCQRSESTGQDTQAGRYWLCERDDGCGGHTSDVGSIDWYILNLNLESEFINPAFQPWGTGVGWGDKGEMKSWSLVNWGIKKYISVITNWAVMSWGEEKLLLHPITVDCVILISSGQLFYVTNESYLNFSVHADFVPPVDLFHCGSLIIQQLDGTNASLKLSTPSLFYSSVMQCINFYCHEHTRQLSLYM